MELKKVQDYYEQLFKLYPDIPQRDIKRIMQFGLKSFLMHNNYGGDVLLQSPNMWLYCGKLMKDPIQYFEYYKQKMITKIKEQKKHSKSLQEYKEYLINLYYLMGQMQSLLLLVHMHI